MSHVPITPCPVFSASLQYFLCNQQCGEWITYFLLENSFPWVCEDRTSTVTSLAHLWQNSTMLVKAECSFSDLFQLNYWSLDPLDPCHVLCHLCHGLHCNQAAKPALPAPNLLSSFNINFTAVHLLFLFHLYTTFYWQEYLFNKNRPAGYGNALSPVVALACLEQQKLV